MLTISEMLSVSEWVSLIEKDYRIGVKRRGEGSTRAYQEAWDNCRRGLETYPGNESLLKEREKLSNWFNSFGIKVKR